MIISKKHNKGIILIKYVSFKNNLFEVFIKYSKKNFNKIHEVSLLSPLKKLFIHSKYLFSPNIYFFYLQQMARTGIQEENKRILMDLEVVQKSHDCPHIVTCYGTFVTEVS